MTKRTRRVLGLTVVLISLLVLGAGCGSSSPSSAEPALDGTSWTLTSWAEPDPIPESASITAEFADGRVAGTSGVNRYNAAVTSGTDGSFAIDAPISTKMAGPEDAMAAERSYLQRLQAATSYRVDGDTLVINDADGQPSLTFTRA
ncbi:MAG TPA: META domain-containing protein [Microlunatus sp.]